jgi:asparagine synthase (glutamine-hydrolysing)
MCGIAGIVGCADRERIERMTRVITHRGPNSSGVQIFEQDGVALGHQRLSILDLSERGHQPMADRDQRVWITFNGEIYNFQEVRRRLEEKGYPFGSNTDTEVILYAYLEWGHDCLKELNGMFAFAIWDTRTRTLFAARDRLGIKPFYYAVRGRSLIFASEIKAILSSGMVPAEPDLKALHTPAIYQAGPSTGFKGVFKLPPGNRLHFGESGLSIKPYWEINPSEDETDEIQATEKLDELLNNAVSGQMLSDVPIGLLLSGGLDSSLILALMAKHGGGCINTFTIKYRECDQKFEQMPDDSKYARTIAQQFHCNHREIEVEPDVVSLLPKMMWHLDEPLADPAAINTYLIAKSARENGIPVLLNGMGGDEVFGGYRKHLACLLADKYQTFVPRFAQALVKSATDLLPAATSRRGLRTVRWAKRFVSFASLPEDMRYLVSSTVSPLDFSRLFANGSSNGSAYAESHFAQAQFDTLRRSDLSYLTRMCLSDTRVFMADHNLTYSDKCTMAIGVEGRPPLTDHKIVEYMFSLPAAFRIRGKTQKYLLKKVAERYLPAEIIYRPKAPFGSPLRAWIRGPLAGMIAEYLSPASLKQRGLYNAQFVHEKIENDKKGVEDNAYLIWTLLCNELWFRTFFS